MMKNFAKLAVLGAAFVAAAPFASADAFLTGQITVSDSPASDMGSNDNVVFTLASVYAGGGYGGTQPSPAPPDAADLNGYYDNLSLYTFSTATVSAQELYSGQLCSSTTSVPCTTPASPIDTEAFYATSFINLNDPGNGDYSVTALGYFQDASGNKVTGYDNINFNTGLLSGADVDVTAGSVTEILAVGSPAPEPSSLVFLGTGLVSAAGMMLRRRRSVVA